MNGFKQERDNLRAEIERLKEESGLLTKPKLLCDMETAMHELEVSQKELDKITTKYHSEKQFVNQIKAGIEDIEDKMLYFGMSKKA